MLIIHNGGYDCFQFYIWLITKFFKFGEYNQSIVSMFDAKQLLSLSLLLHPLV